jgi:superfamily I DNA/RNA helicase
MATGRWYAPHAGALVRRAVLSPSEADILILVMLRNARRASTTLGQVNWVKPIRDSYLMQVFVDEATDFSSVQLACMLELSHPQLRAWFACGDFRQRITRHGITDESDLRWIAKRTGVPPLEIREITTDYRQSARLRRLAAALVPGGQPPSGISSDRLPEEEPEALLAENLAGEQLASWLADRILEIERYLGKLPSIAVFVEREERIDPLVALVRPKLAQHNLRIAGCRDGRDIGSRAEVRVFDIRHIKGLEFEAVFFVGADLLASGLPDLFQQFMFVGITRAATFLGITCEQSLPGSLEKLRSLFSDGTWA